MRKHLAATLLASTIGLAPQAQAAPVTYSFSGTVYAGAPELVGQTVLGSLSYDTALATTTTTCCDLGLVARAQSAETPPGATPYASAAVALSGGTTFHTGDGTLSNQGSSELIKNAGEEGSQGPLNRFRVEAQSTDTGSAWRSIALLASDSLGTSSMLFPDGSAGLANDQPVNWLAAGVSSYGVVFTGSGGTGQLVAQFSLDSISLVPEPATALLLLVGLGAVGRLRSRAPAGR